MHFCRVNQPAVS